MRSLALVLVLALLAFPFAIRQATNNPAYRDSSGYICVGAWFLYNITSSSSAKSTSYFLMNVTVVDMNDTHLFLRELRITQSRNMTLEHVIDCRTGRAIVWMNTTILVKWLATINNTVQHNDYNLTIIILEVNTTYFHCYEIHKWLRYNETQVIEVQVWINEYCVVQRYLFGGYVIKGQTARMLRSTYTWIQKGVLLKWWSPKFLEEEKPEEKIEEGEKYQWWFIPVVLAIVIAVVAYMIASKRVPVLAS